MIDSRPQQFCQLHAVDGQCETEWRVTIVSLPVRISIVSEEPGDSFDAYVRAPGMSIA
jgi:hypothetical protein